MSNSVSGNQHFTKVGNTVVNSTTVQNALVNANVVVTNIIKGYVDVSNVASDYDVKDKDGNMLLLPSGSAVTNIFYSADTGFVGNSTEVKLASSQGKGDKYDQVYALHKPLILPNEFDGITSIRAVPGTSVYGIINDAYRPFFVLSIDPNPPTTNPPTNGGNICIELHYTRPLSLAITNV